jgi:hypothetical protein
MKNGTVPEQQREVQRLLGRCLLRLQQYERLMKALVAHQEIAGQAHELEQVRTQRVEEVATNTLGGLVRKLLGSFVVAEEDHYQLSDGKTIAPDTPAFGYRMSLLMSAVDHAQTVAELNDLITLRNGLVHDFIDQFDLSCADGCAAAQVYLNECYARIDGHVERLRRWAHGMEKAWALMADVVQTPEFADFIVNGIGPDRTIHWPIAGIVGAFREATTQLAIGGWTRLDDAVAFIVERYPDQTPPKYGCRSWRQVLHESRIFDLQYRTDVDDCRVAWFRERGG